MPQHTFTTRSNLQTSSFKPQSNSCPQITRGSWADQQGSLPAGATPESLLSSQHGKKRATKTCHGTGFFLHCWNASRLEIGCQESSVEMNSCCLAGKIVWMKSPTKNPHRCHGPRSVDHRRSRAFTASEFTAAMRKRPLVIKLLGPLDTSVSLWFFIAKLKRWVVEVIAFPPVGFCLKKKTKKYGKSTKRPPSS